MQHVSQIADTLAGKVTSQDCAVLFGNIQNLYDFNRLRYRDDIYMFLMFLILSNNFLSL